MAPSGRKLGEEKDIHWNLGLSLIRARVEIFGRKHNTRKG